jgi:septal ring-binding cell division protein DamX
LAKLEKDLKAMDNSYWNQDEKNLETYDEKAPWWTSRPVLILFLAVVSIAILSVLWHALLPNKPKGNVEVPYVKAETTPIKVRPEHPGGAEIPHKDKRIYDLISDTPQKEEKEVLAPAPEKPMVETKFESPQELLEKPVALEDAKPATTLKEMPAPVDTAPSVPLKKGEFRLQLAALGSQKSAEGHIKVLKKKHATLNSLSIDVIKAKVKGKDFYRIQAGDFATKEEAQAVCQGIKSNGGTCNIVKRS